MGLVSKMEAELELDEEQVKLASRQYRTNWTTKYMALENDCQCFRYLLCIFLELLILAFERDEVLFQTPLKCGFVVVVQELLAAG